jgi:hypothetical protein
MAVDFVKTGQPARMPRELKPKRWPHFMEKKYKTKEQVYHSKKILGRLYDQVERVDFVAAFEAPFDERIMQAYDLNSKMLQDAAELKSEYDEAMHRVMAQHQIETEFEIWSTLVLHHAREKGDYKFHEVVGEISTTLKARFRKACYEKAGGKAFEQIGPFVAAMYTVTSDEMSQALKECRAVQIVGGQEQPVRKMVPACMPLISFPWLFHGILGKIANGPTCWVMKDKSDPNIEVQETKKLPLKKNHTQTSQLEAVDDLVTADRITHRGDVLELFDDLIDYQRESQPVVPETWSDPESSNPSSQAASATVNDLHFGDSMAESANCVSWEESSAGYSDFKSDNLMDTPIGAGQDSPIQVGQVSSPGQVFFKELTGSSQASKPSSKSDVTPSSSRLNLLIAQESSQDDSWETKEFNGKNEISARTSMEDDRANGQHMSPLSKPDFMLEGGVQEDETNPESDAEEEIVHLDMGRTLLDRLTEFNEGSMSS